MAISSSISTRRLPLSHRSNLKLRIDSCRSKPKNNGERESLVPWFGCGEPRRDRVPAPRRADGANSSWRRLATRKREGVNVIWVASAAAVTVALLSVAFPWWLVRREAARWRRFRQTQGEPEVVARRVAANAERSKPAPGRLMVFRSSTNSWEPAGDGGSLRKSSTHDQLPARRGKRRPRGNAIVSCWPAIVLDAVTRF
jgi:hypothetical protein